MNTRILRFLFGTTIALATALLLLAEQVPTPVASSPAVAPAISSAGEILVDTTADEFDVSPNGTCSLREAILAANDLTDFGGCIRNIVLFATTETIFLPSGTYTLTRTGSGEDFDVTGDLDIRRSMIISTTGATPPVVTGDVGWDDRVFHIITGTVTITMKGIIITGGTVTGDGGGGLLIGPGASLVMNDGMVTGNTTSLGQGGGIFNNQGNLILNNVSLSNNQALSGGSCCSRGGGISTYFGTATLSDVTLNNNSAFYQGGGFDAFGSNTVTLTNVTLSNNSAGSDGGAIYNSYVMTLTNVTISNNSVGNEGGGIYNWLATAKLTNVTFSGNYAGKSTSDGGGGIYNDSGTVTLLNTIVANSTRGGNCNTTFGGSYNLSNDGTCGFGLGNNVNVMLGPLANNGGSTLTHMILSSSPAIDAGTNISCPSTDQRGMPRPVNGTCDVGAVERQLSDNFLLYLPLILR